MHIATLYCFKWFAPVPLTALHHRSSHSGGPSPGLLAASAVLIREVTRPPAESAVSLPPNPGHTQGITGVLAR